MSGFADPSWPLTNWIPAAVKPPAAATLATSQVTINTWIIQPRQPCGIQIYSSDWPRSASLSAPFQLLFCLGIQLGIQLGYLTFILISNLAFSFSFKLTTLTVVAATMSSSFNRVYESFRRRLTPDLSSKFQYATVEDLKDAIEEIQNAQAQRHGLRNLNKIKHFLHGLEQYAGVVEQFVQIKPAILGLIWVCCV